MRIIATPCAGRIELTSPDVRERLVLGDHGVEVDKEAATTVAGRGRHLVEAGFIRLYHRLGFRRVAGGAGTPGDVDQIELDRGVRRLEGGLEPAYARHLVAGDGIE